ncbi:MAG TPA: phosphopantetheine-binding protein [Pseudobacteroides sp.]|nr:phosphopantetheine-binding protein [Pseudobacteroides sp.]
MNYDEVYEKTKELIVDYLRVDEKEVNPDTNLVDELCADSIAIVELGFRFSETFSIPMVEGEPELYVMKNLVDFIYNKIQNK